MLKDHLETLNCKVLHAENGQAGVDLFTEKKNEIDLIILDINMPVMNGFDFFADDAPVQILTASVPAERMPKEVFYIPALILLGLIIMVQRRRQTVPAF